MAHERKDLAEIRDVLERARRVVVLGAHPDEEKAAHYVPAYLVAQGYDVVPVNPRYAGTQLWGKTVLKGLADVTGAVDVLDVFRRSEDLASHLPEILAMQPKPKTVWLQLFIKDDAVARALVDAGIDVVQSRCMLADHKRFNLPPVSST